MTTGQANASGKGFKQELRMGNKRLWFYSLGGIVVLSLVALPYLSTSYIVSVFLMLLVYIGYSVSWNILSGLTGYVNFGYSLFVGIAAYTSVILIMDLGLWWPIGWLIGGVAAAIIAIAVGSFMLRLRGSYFAIGMLALLLGIKLLFTSKYLAPITRGGYGFPFIQPLSLNMMYYALLFLVLISIYVSFKIITSPFGARLIAIREDEEGAGSIGINATADKIKAFAISTFFGGLIAAGHFAFQNYIEPESAFNTHWTISPIVMVLLGGPGTVWGPVIGAVTLTFVEEFLWSHFTESYMMIYGLVMAVLVLLMPGGVIEWLKTRGTIPKIRAI
jgi:branched-chain amino acid transport system permease protein